MRYVSEGLSFRGMLAGVLLVSVVLSGLSFAQVFTLPVPVTEPPTEIVWEEQTIPLAAESTQWFYWGSEVIAFTWRADIECLELDALISGVPVGYLEIIPPSPASGTGIGALVLIRQSASGWQLAIVGEDCNESESNGGVVTHTSNLVTNYISVKYRNCPVAVTPVFEEITRDALNSSFINGAFYDRANGYLLILLNSTWYHYCAVPEQVWEEFKRAESKGRFYNAYIKGHYDCRVYPVPRYVSCTFYLTDWGLFLTLEWNDLFMLGFISLDALASLSSCEPLVSSCEPDGAR